MAASFHALCAAEAPLQALLVNARTSRRPGPKSHALDAAWLGGVDRVRAATRQLDPPRQIAAIRELTRDRKKLIEERASELQRLGKSSRTAGSESTQWPQS